MADELTLEELWAQLSPSPVPTSLAALWAEATGVEKAELMINLRRLLSMEGGPPHRIPEE